MFVTLLAACSGEDAAPPTTAPPTTGAAATTTTAAAPPPTTPTTAAPTTTTADPPARPEKLVSDFDRESVDDFDTAGDDLYRVTVELFDLFNFLEGHPAGSANDMAAALVERTYPFWDSIQLGFAELTDNTGWRYVDPGIELLGVRVDSVADDAAVVTVADGRDSQVVADAKGNPVRRYDGWEPEVTSYTLVRGIDGRWRMADLDALGPVGEVNTQDLVPVEWTGRSS